MLVYLLVERPEVQASRQQLMPPCSHLTVEESPKRRQSLEAQEKASLGNGRSFASLG